MSNSTIEQKLQSEIAELKAEVNRIKEEIAIVKEKQEAVEKDKRLGMCSQQWVGLQNHMAGLQNQIVELTKRLGVKEDKLEKITPPSTQGLIGSTVPTRENEIEASTAQINAAQEAIRDAMMTCLTRTIKQAIGKKGELLNIEALRNLLNVNWRRVFGRFISVTIDARESLCTDDEDESYDDFIDLKSSEQHPFFIIYSDALDEDFPETTDSETTFRTFCRNIFDAVFKKMEKLKHRCGPKLKVGANLTYEMLDSRDPSKPTKRSHSVTSSDSQAYKRFKQTSGSSISTRSASPASAALQTTSSITVDSSYSTDSTWSLSSCRPVMLIKDSVNNEIYFIWEYMRYSALSQLKPYAFLFNQEDSSRIFHSFGTVIAHSSVELFYFEQRAGCLKRHLIASFNLLIPSDRLKLVTDMIILYCVVSLVATNKTDRTKDYCPAICRETCSLQFLDDGSVLKLIDLTTLENRFRLKDQRGHLEKLYSELKEDHQSSIVNSLKCKEFKHFPEHNTLLVHLWPRGAPLTAGFVLDNIERFVTDVLAFLESLHSFGYVHGDIRLANIVNIKSEGEKGKTVVKFIVIDYENIRPVCKKVNTRSATCSNHKTMREDGTTSRSCVSPSADFKSLAEIIQKVYDKDSRRKKSFQIDFDALESALAAYETDESLTFDANTIRGFLKK